MYHTTVRRLFVLLLAVTLSSARMHACGNFLYESGVQSNVDAQPNVVSQEGDLLAAMHGKAVTFTVQLLAQLAQMCHNESSCKQDDPGTICRLRHVTPSVSSLDGDHEESLLDTK